jgi:Skp family chaperone for outer membrane proteins
VKRIVLALGLTAVTFACGAGRVLAQQTPPAPTRVAIVNIALLFTKYDKAKTYKANLEKQLEPFQLEGRKLKKEMLEWSEAAKNPKVDAAMRERYEYGVREHQRKLEDLEMQVRKLVGTTNESQMVTLYKEIQEAIKAFAQANGIHVVLGYFDQLEGDPYTFPNISRKMQGMDLISCTPLFHVAGLDISQSVADTLNSAYQRAGGASAAGVVPVSGTSNQK